MTPDAFFTLTEGLNSGLTGQERLYCALSAETSDFVRLNHNRIRQAGSVRSAALGLTLVAGARQAEASCDLTGDPEQDLARARDLLGRLRERLPHVPEDPYLNLSEDPWTSESPGGRSAPRSPGGGGGADRAGGGPGPGGDLGLRGDRRGAGQLHRPPPLAPVPELQPGLERLSLRRPGREGKLRGSRLGSPGAGRQGRGPAPGA